MEKRLGCESAPFVHWATSSWLTAHAPMARSLECGVTSAPYLFPNFELVCGPHCAPDTTHALVNLDFGSCTRAGTTTLPPHTQVPQSTLAHVLTKGLPKRCQIRELNRFLSVYLAKGDSDACRLISTMILSTICGLYPHAENQLCFAKMKHIVCSMKMQRETNYAGLVGWMAARSPSSKHRGNPYAHQMLCFYAIREFTVHSVSRLPGMRTGLARCHWRQFEERVMFTCEAARKCVCDNMASGLRPMLSGVASTMNNIHRSSKFENGVPTLPQSEAAGARCASRAPMRSFGCQAITWTSMHKLFSNLRSQFVAKCKQLHLRPVDLHRQRLHTVAEVSMELGIAARLSARGFSEQGMKIVTEFLKLIHCGARKDALANMATALLNHSPHEYVDLENECKLASIKCSTRICDLSEDVHSAQLAALGRSWGEDFAGCAHAGCAIVCLCCGDFKNCAPAVRESKRNGVLASSARACIDDETMLLYCEQGHNSQSSSARALKCATSNEGITMPMVTGPTALGPCTKANSTVITALENAIAVLWCKQFPLAVVDLKGRIMQHRQSLYVLCTSCSAVVRFDGTDPKSIRCAQCAAESRSSSVNSTNFCASCKRQRGLSPCTVSSVWLPCIVRAALVCSSCFAHAVDKKRAVQPLLHLAEKVEASRRCRDLAVIKKRRRFYF